MPLTLVNIGSIPGDGTGDQGQVPFQKVNAAIAAINAGFPPAQLGQTGAEIAAGVVPVSLAFAAGNILRYGADPTGSADSAPALNAAVAQAMQVGGSPVYVPAGLYLVNSQIPITTATGTGFTIYGDGRETSTLTLGSAAGSGAAVFYCTNGPINSMIVNRLGFSLLNNGLAQIGLRFNQLRDSNISDCLFLGAGGVGVDSTGVSFDGAGIFTGVSFNKNYIASTKNGIACNGVCTSVRILDNDIVGPTQPGSVGVNIRGGACTGILVADNDIEGWDTGVFTDSVATRIIGNTFESNTSFNWRTIRGTGVSQTLTQVIGNYEGGGTQGYTPFSGDGNIIVQRGQIYVENLTSVQNSGFYVEQGRAFGLGMPQTPAFSAGNFAANGAMTWTVAGATTYIWSLYGKTMTVWFDVSGTIGGTPNTLVTIAIPGGFLAAAPVSNPCDVLDNAVWATGLATVGGSSSVISIQKGATVPSVTNYTAGAITVYGQLTFPVQ